ncbi:MAG: 2-C-methyl-D-erythritol 4-phosphate cytidylyltransferase [Gammaproteobacteria bacterium]|nr:2-C-methyl-D-erythritol 4-phosphate cytidylyltransferase [Gammaproteobacteria bacterium]
MSAIRFWAVIPAAGVGSRMTSDIPKQYLSIGGHTVLEHTLMRFCRHPRISGVVVVIARDDHRWPQLGISKHTGIRRAEGGAERMHSVVSGLHLLENEADQDDWVLVHDAARPCIRQADITRLIEKLQSHPVGGLLGWPVRDTMKRVGNNNEVLETIDRTGLWHALTPQMFRLGELKSALQLALEANKTVTDEAQAIEMSGRQPMFVKGAPDNIKITLNTDLEMAEICIRAQETETVCV